MVTVVILGGSYAGLNVAHKLLKHTAPAVLNVKVILVNPSPKFYWNMASVRAIVPGQLKDDQLFQDIAPAFAYAGAKFEFVLGSAEELDVASKSVVVKTAEGPKKLSFDHLVIATGAKGDAKMPWKPAATYEQTIEELHNTQKKVTAANTIVVGGGGATGVETVAELAFEYGSRKDITIITSGATLLAGSMTDKINKGAEKEIRKLGAKIIHNTRVSTVTELPNGQTELTLSDGSKKVVDLYLPSTGMIPNTSFLPKSWLTKRGYVETDTELRVKGQTAIWAIGDVSSLQRCGYMITEAQAAHLHKTLDAVIKGNPPLVYKVPEKDMMAVALGRKKGTGYAMGWKLPSFMVYFAKGKTLGVDKMSKLVTGTGA